MANTVSHDEWLAARKALLAQEKAFNQTRDELSAARREMPWVAVDEEYVFSSENGKMTIGDLFEGRSQLIVYHFMYGEDWQEGCPSCSYWADNFNGIECHLKARDAAFAVVSIAPIEKLLAYKKRMNWDFNWVSSAGNSFNSDFNVSFTDAQRESGEAIYNYRKSTFPGNEAPGVSVFAREREGKVFHTYSTYSRGLDMLNGAYHYMDLLPKGRDEANLPFSMAWLKRNDSY